MLYFKSKKNLVLILLFATTIAYSNCKKSSAGLVKSQQKNKPDTTDHSDASDPLSENDLIIPAAYFTDPFVIRVSTPSTAILDKLIQCIDATPGGESIYVNIYEFDYLPVSFALKKAYERGVRLMLMIDSSKKSSREGNKQTFRMFRSVLKAPSELITINNKSWPSAINHHKDILFSSIEAGGKKYKNVVFITSHNFTSSQMNVLQDAVILSNEELYNACIANYKEMKLLAHSGMKDFEFSTFHSSDKNIRAYFYPKRHNGEWDGSYLIMDILNELSDFTNDTIMIGMGRWSDGQIEIANKLIELKNKGVHIEIITRYEGGSGLGLELTKKLKDLEAEGGMVLFLPKPHIIHSKYMLIKGTWQGKRHHVMMNGSLNWSNPSTQHNNNLVLMLIDSPLFDKYEDNFEKIKSVF